MNRPIYQFDYNPDFVGGEDQKRKMKMREVLSTSDPHKIRRYAKALRNEAKMLRPFSEASKLLRFSFQVLDAAERLEKKR